MGLLKWIIDLWKNAEIWKDNKKNRKALKKRKNWLKKNDDWQDEMARER
jgi:hypothetical protein